MLTESDLGGNLFLDYRLRDREWTVQHTVMGQSIGRLVADGLPREVATAMIGLLIGWYMSRPGMQARSPGTTLSLLAKRDSTKKNQDSSKAYFVIPTCFDIRRQAQLVRQLPDRLSCVTACSH